MARMSKMQKEMLEKEVIETEEDDVETCETPSLGNELDEVSIQKFEKHDETPPPVNDYEGNSNMRMNYEFKLISMTNAIKILPPNLIKNGRHSRENVQAICGFMVDEEMMDAVYKDFKHEVYN